MSYLSLAEKEKALSDKYLTERDTVLEKFSSWAEQDQTDFAKLLLRRMCHQQHGQIDQFLKPMLQRDFITLLPGRSPAVGGVTALQHFSGSRGKGAVHARRKFSLRECVCQQGMEAKHCARHDVEEAHRAQGSHRPPLARLERATRMVSRF